MWLSLVRLVGAAALLLVACAHRTASPVVASHTAPKPAEHAAKVTALPAWDPPTTIPMPREAHVCAEWQTLAELKFPNTDERYGRLTVDKLGRPTIAVIEALPNGLPTERSALTVHHWNGVRWERNTLRRFSPVVPPALFAVQQPGGRIGVILRHDNNTYAFEGPPWVDSSLSLPDSELLGAATDEIGGTHFLLRQRDSLVYATGSFAALDVRWRIPSVIASWANVHRFAVSPRGTRFAIFLEADNRKWLIEGDPVSPQGRPPAMQKLDQSFDQYSIFSVDDDGTRYDMYGDRRLSQFVTVQPIRSSKAPWQFPNHQPFNLREEERRCVSPTDDKQLPDCAIPAATFTFPVLVPVPVPPTLRRAGGPALIAIGARVPLEEKLGLRRAVCGNDSGEEGAFRAIANGDGRLVMTGLYDEAPRVRSQVMPTITRSIRNHTASLQIDAYGRAHALFSEQHINEQVSAMIMHYVLLGCSQ